VCGVSEPPKPSLDPDRVLAAAVRQAKVADDIERIGAISDEPSRSPPRAARASYTPVERLGWGLAFAVLFAMLALTAGREKVIAWLHRGEPTRVRDNGDPRAPSPLPPATVVPQVPAAQPARAPEAPVDAADAKTAHDGGPTPDRAPYRPPAPAPDPGAK